MSRRWKIAIGVFVALVVLLAINTLVINAQTKQAEVTIAGGRILEVSGPALQVVEEGPAPARVSRRADSNRPPIVLIHCYTCSLHWWDGIAPLLADQHRVIRVDLLGHGGSEKPSTGYSIQKQAELVAVALNRLGVREGLGMPEGAVVVGHSMGFDVAMALAEQSSKQVKGLVNIGEAPDPSYEDLPLIASLGYVPVLGQLLNRLTPDFAVEEAYESAFAPGFEVESGFEEPDRVVKDFRAMNYRAYDSSASAADDYEELVPLDERAAEAGIPLLVIFGDEDQIWTDADEAAQEYADVPEARVEMMEGAGHSPNVERPEDTARLVAQFTAELEEPPGPPRRPDRGRDREVRDRDRGEPDRDRGEPDRDREVR